MPITVHRAPPRKQTFAEQIGLNDILANIGAKGAAGLAEGMGYVPPEHKRALQIEQLKGERAQEVEQLRGQKALDVQRLKGVQQEQKINHQNMVRGLQGEQFNRAFQNIQDIYSNPELSDEQKTFGVYEQLAQNPVLAQKLLGSVNQQTNRRNEQETENIAADQFSRGYDAIVKGDNDSLKQVLQDPATPLDVRKKLIDLRSQQDVRSSVNAREVRNRQSMVGNAYQRAITNELAKMKNPPGIFYEERKKTIDEAARNIKRLEAQQKADLKRLAADPESYSRLKIWDNDAGEYLPDEEEIVEPQNAEELLNSLSDEQIGQLFYESRGDINKAKELALQRYSR